MTRAKRAKREFDASDLVEGWFLDNYFRVTMCTISPQPAMRNAQLDEDLRSCARDTDQIFNRRRCVRTILHSWFCRLDEYATIQRDFDDVRTDVGRWNRLAEEARFPKRLGNLLVGFRFDRANENQVEVLRRSLLERYANLFSVLHHRITWHAWPWPMDPVRVMRDDTKKLDILVQKAELRALIADATSEADRAVSILRAVQRGERSTPFTLQRLASVVRYFGGDPEALSAGSE